MRVGKCCSLTLTLGRSLSVGASLARPVTLSGNEAEVMEMEAKVVGSGALVALLASEDVGIGAKVVVLKVTGLGFGTNEEVLWT